MFAADDERAVEQGVTGLATRLGQESAGVAGRPVEVAEPLTGVLGAEWVCRTPGRGFGHPQECLGQTWGFALLDEASEGAFGVSRGGVHEDSVLVLFGTCVDPFAEAGRRVAGFKGELADEEVRERVQEDEAGESSAPVSAARRSF